MPKNIIFKDQVRDKLRAGINKLADAVKVTLGPTGRIVMIERDFSDPVVTKDGVAVAKQIELPDRIENMGAMMVKQAASKTASVAGDGTTTATIYAQAIYEAGIKTVHAGAKPQDIKRGINKAVDAIIGRLAEMSKAVTNTEEIRQVASCSANQDEEVGKIIAEAMDAVGRDGVVTIEEGQGRDVSVKVVDGYQFDQGYLSPHFCTNKEEMICEYDNPLILLCDERITSVKSIVKILDHAVRASKPIIIVADDVDGEALTAMIINSVRGALEVVAVKAPGFGDRKSQTLEDIATATGATVVSRGTGLSLADVESKHFGTCEKITITGDTTTIVEGDGDEKKIENRINQIKKRLENTSADFDREKLQERLSKLAGGVAQIVVGGTTEVEMRERKDRIDDALHACKAATEEGILPGGGISVLKARSALDKIECSDDEKMGVDIIRRAVEAPLRQIAINTGVDEGAVLLTVTKNDNANFGFNAANGNYEDLHEAGVIVPLKVERVALQNAASVAILLLSTDCMISTIPEKNDIPQGDPGIYPNL